MLLLDGGVLSALACANLPNPSPHTTVCLSAGAAQCAECHRGYIPQRTLLMCCHRLASPGAHMPSTKHLQRLQRRARYVFMIMNSACVRGSVKHTFHSEA